METTFRRLFSFAMLLAGLNPEAFKYSFVWGAKDRDDIDAKIKRAKDLQLLGFSFETIHQVCGIGDVTFEEETRRVVEQIKAGDVPYGMNTKLDPIVAMLSGMAANQGNGKPEKTEALIEEIQHFRVLAERNLAPGGRVMATSRRS